MIVDFLTAQVRRRAAHGQPEAEKSLTQVYLNCVKTFEFLDPDIQKACIGAREFVGPLLDRPKILFVRPKSEAHFSGIAPEYQAVCIDHNSTSAGFERDGVVHLPDMYWRYLVGKLFETEGESREAWTQFLIDEVEAALRTISPKLILFITDVQYLERLIALVAKSLDIPTATIQHGLFSGRFEPTTQEGDACDYFIAWSEFTKRLLLQSGYLPEKRIFVSGYPYPFQRLTALAHGAPRMKSVVMLGQPFENFNLQRDQAKLEITRRVMNACGELGLSFGYRPHPAENTNGVRQFVAEEKMLASNAPLADVFRDHGVFVSLTSSAVVEAGLYGRVAIQVYDDVFESENFEELGACYACENAEAAIREILEKYRNGQLPPKEVSPDYLPVVPAIPAVFAGIYKAIVQDVEPVRAFAPKPVAVKALTRPGPASSDGAKARVIDAVAAIRPVPAFLDVEELSAEVESWTGQEIESLYGAFLLASRRQGASYTVQVSPPLESKALTWLKCMEQAFEIAGSIPTTFQFIPVQTPIPNDSIAMRAHLVYGRLSSMIDSQGRMSPRAIEDARRLLEKSFSLSIAEAMIGGVDPNRSRDLTLSEARAGRLLEVRNELLPYRERLDRLRASSAWKVGTRLLRLVGREL